MTIDTLTGKLLLVPAPERMSKTQRSSRSGSGRMQTADNRLFSPNHSVRSRQHIPWNCQADLLSGFEIDCQLELRRLLDGKIGGSRAFQDSVNVDGSAVGQVSVICPVAHQATIVDKFSSVVYHWKPKVYRELCKLSSLINEDGALQHEGGVSTFLGSGSECRLNF